MESATLLLRRRELVAITLCVLIGAGLRLWLFGSLGLTHFDEGIYALSGAWSVTGGSVSAIDPMVIPYAPPGYPVLVGLSYWILGTADVSAILVSALCGIVTIPLAAWVARRTFGAGAAVPAAVFAALSIAHVAFSRKALTDVPFLFSWLLALGLGGRFLEKPRLGRALVFGIAVGLAQNFKYNGWLAGIVILLAALIGCVASRESRRREHLARTFGFGLVAILAAALIYWPWFDFVERHGGYSGLLRHHRNYLDPPASWLPNWQQQLRQAVALSGGRSWSVFTWVMAWLGGVWAIHGARIVSQGSRRGWYRFGGGLIAGAAVFAGFSPLAWCVGLILVPRLFMENKPASRVVAVWWTLLSIMTPFYHPYARLWLPLEGCGWILLAGSIRRLDPFDDSRTVPAFEGLRARARQLVTVCGCVLAAIVLILQTSGSPFPLGRIYQSTATIREGIARLATTPISGLSPGDKLLVLGRRPLTFYLLLQGRFPFQLAASLNALVSGQTQGKWLIIDSVQLTQELGTNQLPEILERQPNRHRLYTEMLDPVTLLDVRPAAAASRDGERPAETWLIRLETVSGVPPKTGARERAPATMTSSGNRALMKPEPPVYLWPDPNFLGPVTDLYQLTMIAGYLAAGKDRELATFEVFVRRMPQHRAYLVFAGLEQAIADLLQLSFSPQQVDALRQWPVFAGLDERFFDALLRLRFEGEIWAIPEGSVVFAGEPLVRVVAPLPQAQWVETFLLASLGYPTLVASKAARVVEAAAGRPVFDFGARRGQGPQASLIAARAAYLAGCAGTSQVEAARRLGISCVGTMAHSWVQSFPTEAEAFDTFAKIFPEFSTLLVDTYDTQTGVRAAAKIEPPVKAIRLDSGDLLAESLQARALLDEMGRPGVKILGSGDLDEFSIEKLVAGGAAIDAFGVGTELITSRDAPALSLVYKLVELEGAGKVKLSPGKRTYPLAKQVHRFRGSDERFTHDLVTKADETASGESLLTRIVAKGRLVQPFPALDEIRNHCRVQLESLPICLRGVDAEPIYPLEYSDALELEATRLGVRKPSS